MCKEVLTILSIPEIIVALKFEAEMGNYFEVTSHFHAMTGILSNRPGFRMLEINSLLFEFLIPWWENSRIHPRKVFPNTFTVLQNVSHDIRKMKEKKLLRESKKATMR